MFTTGGLSLMSEKESSNRRKNLQMHDIKECPCISILAIRGFLSQFSGKLQKHLKSRFKRPTEEIRANREMFKLKDSKFNLEKQLAGLDKKILFVMIIDPLALRHLQVIVPKGSFCQLNVKVNVGLPPDAIYNIVTDPNNKRVFKNIHVGSTIQKGFAL